MKALLPKETASSEGARGEGAPCEPYRDYDSSRRDYDAPRSGYDPLHASRDYDVPHAYDAPRDYEPAPVYAETEEVVEEPVARTKADVLREQIVRALRRNNGRRREAAAELFMSERTLYRKIKELGIEA